LIADALIDEQHPLTGGAEVLFAAVYGRRVWTAVQRQDWP
jgi:hypothetical protein